MPPKGGKVGKGGKGAKTRGKQSRGVQAYINQLLETVDPDTDMIMPPPDYQGKIDGFDEDGNPFRPNGIVAYVGGGDGENKHIFLNILYILFDLSITHLPFVSLSRCVFNKTSSCFSNFLYMP